MASGNGADFGNSKNFPDLCPADNPLFIFWSKHSLHGLLHVIDGIINNTVETNIYLIPCGKFCGLVCWAYVESDNDGVGRAGQNNIRLGDTPDRVMNRFDANFLIFQVSEGLLDGVNRALDIRLYDQIEFFNLTFENLLVQVVHGDAGGFCQLDFPLLLQSQITELSRPFFILNHHEVVTGLRNIRQTHHFYRSSRNCFFNFFAFVIDKCSDLAKIATNDERFTDSQGAALNNHGGDRSAPFIQFGFDHHSFTAEQRVCFQFHDFCLQEQVFKEVINSSSLQGRDLHVNCLSTPIFRQEAQVGQCFFDLIGLCVRFVNLVDSDKNRNTRRFRVVNRFFGLGFDSVIGGHNQNDNICHLRTPGPHGCEGFVSRRVEESDG